MLAEHGHISRALATVEQAQLQKFSYGVLWLSTSVCSGYAGSLIEFSWKSSYLAVIQSNDQV